MRLHSVTPEEVVNLVVTAGKTYISQVFCMVTTTVPLRVSDVNKLSSQSPINALDISCSPYKTYNYVKYIKI
jgi:hypothetical protein